MARLVRLLFVMVLASAVASGGPLVRSAYAQESAAGVLTLNQERLWAQSLFGAKVLEELERSLLALTEENSRIQAELEFEENELKDLRPSLEPEEFRDLASAFDEKVQELRQRQSNKVAEINQQAEAQKVQFFEKAFPLLFQLMTELGGAVIIDQRSMILSSRSVDMTEAAIARIDEVLGDGSVIAPVE